MSVEAAKRRSPLSHRLAPYLLLTPAIILVLVAQGYPMFRQFIMSFQEFGLAQQFGQPAKWVWLDNYATIVSDSYFWTVLLKSLVFCFWTAGLTMIFGLGLALLMRSASTWARTVMNVALVVVWAMPLIAALTVWQWLVDPNFGLLNYVLTSLGLSQFQGFSWLASSFWTFYLIASAIIIWASMPLVTISLYAGLTQVDEAQIEASELDGANYVKRFQHVILPTVAPIISLMVIAVWMLGVGTLKDLALVLLIGIIVGTYSSIFTATPLLVSLKERQRDIKAHNGKVLERRALAAEKAERAAASGGVAGTAGTATLAAKPKPGARPRGKKKRS